jgi:hypothetical protein
MHQLRHHLVTIVGGLFRQPIYGPLWGHLGLLRSSPPLVLNQRDRGRGLRLHDRFECFLECFGTALLNVSFASTFVTEALATFALFLGLIFLTSSGGDDVGQNLVELHWFWGEYR